MSDYRTSVKRGLVGNMLHRLLLVCTLVVFAVCEADAAEVSATQAAGDGSHEVTITLNHDIWWLGGEDGPGVYTNKGTLTAKDAPAAGLTWAVSEGTARATVTPVANTNRATITSAGSSGLADDVTVQVSRGGHVVGTLKLTVYTAAIAIVLPNYPKDSTFQTGFKTQYKLKVFDQFDKALQGLSVNEQFGAWHDDFLNENWPEPEAYGTSTTTDGSFYDVYSYADASKTPPPVNPNKEGFKTPVKHAVQTYRAGSLTPGRGVMIAIQTLQFYRGRARQE